MYVDLYTRIATAKAISAGAITTITDTIDMLQAREVGQGEDIYVVFTITTAFNAGITYFQVGYGDSAVPANFTPITQTNNYAQADLVVGKQIVCRVNPVISPSSQSGYVVPNIGRQWLCAQVVVTNSSSNTGAFTCDVVHTIQGARGSYPSGLPAFVAGA